jgi:hypothetical protein
VCSAQDDPNDFAPGGSEANVGGLLAVERLELVEHPLGFGVETDV